MHRQHRLKFEADDEDTWTPELRLTVHGLDELTDTREVLYALGYVIAAIETTTAEAGHPVDLADLLETVSDRLAKA